VYLRSFADSNADGVGDLDGVRSRLDYLRWLGVDALWITPCYPSPMADHGYDVADPRDIDPLFGDLAAFDALVGAAHGLGIRLILDLVPNHTSDQHPWFSAALAAPPGSPERARYHFRDGDRPPNNWPSQFGGPAWTRTASDGQWYLHLFAPEQPDLNWANPEVWTDLASTLRFWFDRGVDGFRIDVAHGMAKPPGLPDAPAGSFGALDGRGDPDVRFDHEDVHPVLGMIRSVTDEYRDRVLIGEIWVRDDERFARYLRPDELHLGFNFRLTVVPFDAAAIRAAIEHALTAGAAVGAPPTWTLSNHDVPRVPTRLGGLWRARALALVELGLPGTVFVYNGEELGLPSVELPDEALRDPIWERSGHTRRGRDAHRIPVPWDGSAPPYGFTAGDASWLPMPEGWGPLTVQAQRADPDSTLSLYRRAIELRHIHPGFAGDRLEWLDAPDGCFAYRRVGGLTCALNASPVPVALPAGRLLLASGPFDVRGGLPPDTAAWLV
jgi:alpha-glucosidase